MRFGTSFSFDSFDQFFRASGFTPIHRSGVCAVCAFVCGSVEVACSQLCATRSALLQHSQGLNKSRQHQYVRFASDGAFYFATATGVPITAQSSML